MHPSRFKAEQTFKRTVKVKQTGYKIKIFPVLHQTNTRNTCERQRDLVQCLALITSTHTFCATSPLTQRRSYFSPHNELTSWNRGSNGDLRSWQSDAVFLELSRLFTDVLKTKDMFEIQQQKVLTMTSVVLAVCTMFSMSSSILLASGETAKPSQNVCEKD